MLLGLCVLFMQALQTPSLVTLVRTEGGINPSEEKVVFFEDGTVVRESWSLAQRERQRFRGRLDSRQLETLEELVGKAQAAGWPAALNEAQGVQAAFALSLTWRWQGQVRTVTGYTFGSPPLPQGFLEVTQALAELAQRVTHREGER